MTINFSTYLCKVVYIKHDEDYLFYFIELAILLSSCSSEKTNDRSIIADSETLSASQLNQNNSQSVAVSENFYDFLEKFSTDRIFQLKRIVFPIKAVVSDLDEEEEGIILKEETIQKQEWEHLDLTYDSTYITRECDQYYQDVLLSLIRLLWSFEGLITFLPIIILNGRRTMVFGCFRRNFVLIGLNLKGHFFPKV